jgi:hypothetical protein
LKSREESRKGVCGGQRGGARGREAARGREGA